MRRLEHLDGLRGVAALMVTLSHFESMINSVATGSYSDKTPLGNVYTHLVNGAYAVMIFFVLSGYVLLSGYARTGHAAFAFGAVKRYFRLMPPILAALLLATALSWTFGFHHIDVASRIGGHPWLEAMSPLRLNPGDALYQGLFGAFVGQHDYIGALWTMKIEFFGSLLLFALAALAYHRNWYWMAAAAASALLIGQGGDVGLYLSLFFVGSIFFKHALSVPVWLIVFGFLLGLVKPTDIAAQVLALVLPWLTEGPKSAAFFLNAVGAAVTLLAVVRPSGVSVMLAAPPLAWLGRVSFSLYLCHMPIMQSIGLLSFLAATPVIGAGPAAGVAFLVSLIGSLVMAEILTRVTDIPAQRLANRLAAWILAFGKRRKPATA